FKRHGEKISLASLLTTVLRHWQGGAAFYRETDSSGEEGHVLVLSPAPSEDQVRNVLKGFRAGHPRAAWPLRLESAPVMPLLSNGKVDVVGLPAVPGKTVHWYQRL